MIIKLMVIVKLAAAKSLRTTKLVFTSERRER